MKKERRNMEEIDRFIGKTVLYDKSVLILETFSFM